MINFYLLKFLRNRLDKYPLHYPFFQSISAFDIKSYAARVLQKDYTDINRNNYPIELHSNKNHTHKAIDDAREYARLLVKLLNM